MKLSKAQDALLRKIVATNGGGLPADIRSPTVKILHEKYELIQGKSSCQMWAVHTKKGLEYVRNNPVAA